MKAQRIIVDIDRDGKITADAEGFTGDACLKDLERLLEGLASAPEEVTRKAATGGAQATTQTAAKVTAGRKP
jgi:hypothetical protein